MPDPILIAKAFGITAAISLTVTLLCDRSSRKTIAAASSVLAVVSALYAGLWILDLLPHAPPREALDRLLLIIVPSAAVAELVAAASGRIGWVGRGAVAASVAPVLLWGSVYTTDLSGSNLRAWSIPMTWGVYAMFAVLLLAAWILTIRLANRAGEGVSLVSVAGTGLGAGLVIMLSGYATGGQLAVPLAAGLAGVGLGSVVSKNTGWKSTESKSVGADASAAGVGIVTLFALLVIGRLFAGLTSLNAALLLEAPLLGWAAEAIPSGPRCPSRAAAGIGGVAGRCRAGSRAAEVCVGLAPARLPHRGDARRLHELGQMKEESVYDDSAGSKNERTNPRKGRPKCWLEASVRKGIEQCCELPFTTNPEW